ncbi:type II secretion system F family protein [Austwickia chelonae]|uniref:type II secretion system F family protein n=1 Tax=Austwickia chelonae TaxID=100225 RepID=UPI000E237FD4|nr:type II secretion system F family protein [Austwickia chelonae]
MSWYPVLSLSLIVVAVLCWPITERTGAAGSANVGGGGGIGAGDEPVEAEPSHGRRWRRAPKQAAPSVEDVATTCELVALALSAGAGVGEALEAVARDAPPQVQRALVAVVAGRRWGLPEEQVWAFPGERWAPLVRALHLAEAAGVPPSGPLRQAAADLRVGSTHRLEVATARLRVKIVLPLGLCFLPAFVLTSVVPVVLALATRLAQP